MTLFDEFMQDERYQDLLKQLPEDQQAVVKEYIRKFIEDFEQGILDPIRNMKE